MPNWIIGIVLDLEAPAGNYQPLAIVLEEKFGYMVPAVVAKDKAFLGK